jgi:hypothetical protein
MLIRVQQGLLAFDYEVNMRFAIGKSTWYSQNPYYWVMADHIQDPLRYLCPDNTYSLGLGNQTQHRYNSYRFAVQTIKKYYGRKVKIRKWPGF